MSHRYRFGPQAGPYSQKVKYNPLSEIVGAGTVRIGKILEWFAAHLELIWGKKITSCFRAATREEFLKAVGVEESKIAECFVDFIPSSKKWEGHMQDACEWDLIKEITAENRASLLPLSYVRYFGVPKDDDCMRAITSARLLNMLVGAPPSFKLIAHIVLLQLMAEFETPHLATSDYKNHFYLFRLPVGAEGLFVISIGGKEYFLLDIPMGFSWSPFWAEGFTSAVMYRAREVWAAKNHAGAQPAIPTEMFEEYIKVTMQPTKKVSVVLEDGTTTFKWVDDGVPVTVAFLTAVYDNVLVIAKDKMVQDQLIAALNDTNTFFGIKVKEQKGATNGWFTNGEDVVEAPTLEGKLVKMDQSRSERAKRNRANVNIIRTLTYLGVQYVRVISLNGFGYKGIGYRHAPENVKRWREQFTEMKKLIKKGKGAISSRNGSEVGGVTIWVCRVCNKPLGYVGHLLRCLSKIGKAMVEAVTRAEQEHGSGVKKFMMQKMLWDMPSPLTKDEQKKLLDDYEELLTDLEKRTVMMSIPSPQRRNNRIYACSDSSGWRLAGMTLQGDAEYKTVVNILWSEIDPLNLYWHINLKEAKVAIMTCIAIAEAVPPELRDDTVIVFGEDNTTALAGLNSFNFPKDVRVNGEMMELHQRLGGVQLAAFYMNTHLIPADDLTRDRVPSAKKCTEAHLQLERDYQDRGSSNGFC